MENPLKIRQFFDLEAPIRKLDKSEQEAVVFLGKVGAGISREHLLAGQTDRYDGIFLLLDQEDLYAGATVTLPETDCVRIRFSGSIRRPQPSTGFFWNTSGHTGCKL